MFPKNKSPISSSRFPNTSPYLCKVICSQGLFMVMLTCATERMTSTRTVAIDSTGLYSPYVAGSSPLVLGCQASRKDPWLWECYANLAKSTAKWSSLFPTRTANGGIHLLPTEGLSQRTRLFYHQLQENHLRTPKDLASITSRQHRSPQWLLESQEDYTERDTQLLDGRQQARGIPLKQHLLE